MRNINIAVDDELLYEIQMIAAKLRVSQKQWITQTLMAAIQEITDGPTADSTAQSQLFGGELVGYVGARTALEVQRETDQETEGSVESAVRAGGSPRIGSGGLEVDPGTNGTGVSGKGQADSTDPVPGRAVGIEALDDEDDHQDEAQRAIKEAIASLPKKITCLALKEIKHKYLTEEEFLRLSPSDQMRAMREGRHV